MTEAIDADNAPIAHPDTALNLRIPVARPDLGELPVVGPYVAKAWKGMGFTGPIVVQLQRSGGAPCFGATYSAPFLRNDGVNFRDRAD